MLTRNVDALSELNLGTLEAKLTYNVSNFRFCDAVLLEINLKLFNSFVNFSVNGDWCITDLVVFEALFTFAWTEKIPFFQLILKAEYRVIVLNLAGSSFVNQRLRPTIKHANGFGVAPSVILSILDLNSFISSI